MVTFELSRTQTERLAGIFREISDLCILAGFQETNENVRRRLVSENNAASSLAHCLNGIVVGNPKSRHFTLNLEERTVYWFLPKLKERCQLLDLEAENRPAGSDAKFFYRMAAESNWDLYSSINQFVQ